jgi:triosephosphate isomerase (TIM)
LDKSNVSDNRLQITEEVYVRKFIVGNWKMNGTNSHQQEISNIVSAANAHSNVDCGLCVPATLLANAAQLNAGFRFGGQDCHHNPAGAHTGCISAEMLADAGATLVILGHSERRADNNESSKDVCAKALAARRAGLHAIICVGETEAQRSNGQAIEVVLEQLKESVPDNASEQLVSIAYEPVWAIGTGRIPSCDDVHEMHSAIRGHLISRFANDGAEMQILYGGSMNGDNAATLLAIENVDGGLIGGASLTSEKFLPILSAAQSAAL